MSGRCPVVGWLVGECVSFVCDFLALLDVASLLWLMGFPWNVDLHFMVSFRLCSTSTGGSTSTGEKHQDEDRGLLLCCSIL